jgi:hypothetical protein
MLIEYNVLLELAYLLLFLLSIFDYSFDQILISSR